MFANDLNFNGNALLPARSKSAVLIARPRNYENLYQDSSNNFNSDSLNYGNESPRKEVFNSDSFQDSYANLKNASVHEIIRAKNTTERIEELERANLKLRRMLSMSVDPSNVTDTPRVLSSRTVANNLLGPPVLRQGRIGSSWRHIRQTNNYSNSNLLFIDGTVRIDDTARYPPRMYGYPPKNIHREPNQTNRNHELLGLNTQSLQSLNNIDLPINNIVKNRPLNLAPYENKFSQRAKEGFEYWTKDKRYPENNKPKAATIAVGHPYFKSGF